MRDGAVEERRGVPLPVSQLWVRGHRDQGPEARDGWRPSADLLLRKDDDQVTHPPKGGYEMETLKMSLCPMCTACPEVEIAGDEVRIGEAGNLALLKRDEWNVLVDLIQSGQLTRL